MGLSLVFVVYRGNLRVARLYIERQHVFLRMQLNKFSAGIACTRSAGLDDHTRQSATTHSWQHGDAPHNVGLPRRNVFVHVTCRRHRGFRICRALQLLGKHARAAGELTIHIQRHMNAARGLIDLVELDFITLFVHKDGAAHQRRILKASRLDLNIHGRPSHQSKR